MSPSPTPASEGRHPSPEGERRTLGALLYGNAVRNVPSELAWRELLRSVATGDRDALRRVYERTHRLVFTLLVRVTGSRETAEELTVDVFHDVWRRASSYETEGGSVAGWVMGLAFARAVVASVRGRRPDFDQQGARLRSALAELTADERVTIEAAYFDGRTCREIARRSGEPLEHVEARLRSGFEKLRKSLGQGGA